jgi:hypothetical protein
MVRKYREVNQVKLRGYSSNKVHLYTGDRGRESQCVGLVSGMA